MTHKPTPCSLNKCGKPREQGVPVFLGIKRTHNKAPEKWLGIEDYQLLAADIWVPPDDPRRIHRWVESQKEGYR